MNLTLKSGRLGSKSSKLNVTKYLEPKSEILEEKKNSYGTEVPFVKQKTGYNFVEFALHASKIWSSQNKNKKFEIPKGSAEDI